MSKKILRLATGLILTLSTTAQAARLPRCEAVFAPDSQIKIAAREILEQHYEVDNATLLHKIVVKYSARQLNLHKAPRSRELQENLVRTDRMIRLVDRLSRNESVPETAETRWVQREILSRSLENLMLERGYDQNQTRGILKRIFSHRAVQFLLNPAQLPFVTDRQIPAPLMERVLRDGPASTKNELLHFYKSQNQNYVEGYRSFSTAYKFVALSLFAVLSWQGYEDAMDQMNEKKKQKLDHSLESMTDFLNDLDQELEKRGLYNQTNLANPN